MRASGEQGAIAGAGKETRLEGFKSNEEFPRCSLFLVEVGLRYHVTGGYSNVSVDVTARHFYNYLKYLTALRLFYFSSWALGSFT